MNKKTKLLNIFQNYKREYEESQRYLKEIEGSTELTDEGKEQAKKKLFDRLVPSTKRHHDEAVSIIETGLNDLEKKWKKKSADNLLNAGYQAGLSNVLKMIELDAIKTKYDIDSIIEAYSGDFNAMAALKVALKQSPNQEIRDLAYIIPEDTRENTRRLLQQLKKNVDRYIDSTNLQHTIKSWNAFNQPSGNVAASMDGMMQFVTDRLNDDLEVIK